MHIVIMGCGRVGSQLARALSVEGHSVSIIDRDPKAFSALGAGFKGNTVEGIGFDHDVLTSAGIEMADSFIAVTEDDNANIVSAMVARNRFRVPKVIARLYNPDKERLYQHFGIQTMSTTGWAANKIKNLVTHGELIRHMSFGNGEVELVEGQIPLDLSGRQVSEVTIPGEIQVAAIVRFGRALVPSLGTVLQEGDGVQVVVASASAPKLKQLLRLE